MGSRSAGWRRALGLGAALAAGAVVSGAEPGSESGASQDGSPSPAAAPTVGLDALLRLPSAAGPGPSNPGAADRQRWQERFDATRAELDAARGALARSQEELESMAGRTENWQMAAPGAQPTADNSPISYKLRQDIRRQREEVRQAERRLRDLEVEASLAGVPAEWRQPQAAVDASP